MIVSNAILQLTQLELRAEQDTSFLLDHPHDQLWQQCNGGDHGLGYTSAHNELEVNFDPEIADLIALRSLRAKAT